MRVNVVVTNYLELNMGLDLALVANMLVLSMDTIAAVVAATGDGGGGVDAGDGFVADANAETETGDDGHLWLHLEAVRWMHGLICLLLLWLWRRYVSRHHPNRTKCKKAQRIEQTMRWLMLTMAMLPLLNL